MPLPSDTAAAELRAAVSASIPAHWFTAPPCPVCDAGRGQGCVVHHKDRARVKGLMDAFGIPIPDGVTTVYRRYPDRDQALLLRSPAERGPWFEFHMIFTEYKRDLVACNLVSGGVTPGRSPSGSFRLPLALVPVVVALLTTPDTGELLRSLGTVLSDQRSNNPVQSIAQTLFSVATTPGGRLHPHTRDGRFEFGGVTEPFPGCWPVHPLRQALDGDLTQLWPYLTGSETG